MTSARACVAAAALLGVTPLIALAGCTDDAGGAGADRPSATPSVSRSASPTATPTPTRAAGPPYRTKNFALPLSVPRPSWLPAEPTADEARFLTWTGTGADVDRAVRFLLPVGVYDPGSDGRLGPVPRDYLAYLRGLERYGADVSDPVPLQVGGRPAQVVTASTSTGLSGSLGCPARGLRPDDCYGLQIFAVLHVAVVDVGGQTLLAWARTLPGAPESEADFAALESLLADVRFR